MSIKAIGQKLLNGFNRFIAPWSVGLFDRYYLNRDIETNYVDCLQRAVDYGNKPGFKVLEIGSRAVTGPSLARGRFDQAEYVGLDFHPGENVDVVGDAHKLSTYFEEKFDLVYSSAVFEHLAAPWIVAEEISKVLKPGGIVVIATHFSFGAHERPWNFFQFSDMGLRFLFPEALGFTCLNAGMSNPMVGRFSSLAHQSLRFKPVPGLYCSSHYIGRKEKTVEDFDWRQVDAKAVTDGMTYPLADK